MSKDALDSALLHLVAIVESADAAIYSSDLTGIITSWNPAAERIFGYSAAEAVGQPIHTIIPPGRWDEEQEVLARVRSGQSIDHYETIRRRSDGTTIDVALTVSPIRGPHGDIVGISKIARDITRQRDLQTQARHLAAIVESSDDAIISKDLNGVIQSWNRAAEAMFGYTASEVVGQSIRLIIPSDRHREEDDILRRVQQGQGISHAETVRRRRDGTVLPVALTVSPILDETGSIVGASTIARDISQRTRHEQQLMLQSRLLDLSDEAMFAWELDGGIVTWNRGSELLYGFSSAEALGRLSHGLLQTVHPEPISTILARLRAGQQWEGELRHRARDGREIIVESHQQPLEVGGQTLVIETNRNIGARKKAAERAAFLAEAGRTLAGSLDYEATLTAVANLAVPVLGDWCAVDIIGANNQIERLAVAHIDPSRVELARAVQDRYDDPKSPQSPSYVIRTAEPSLVEFISDDMIVASARGDEQRIKMIRALGLVSYLCVPLIAHGRVLGALTLATSESGRRYTIEDLRSAQEIAYRAALAVDNAQAYKDAQLANQLKDEFLATLSHELRTPLNAILGYTRMLQSDKLPAEKRSSSLVTIERNANALSQIIEDILDVSRIISGKVRLDIQPVDLPTVVKNATDSILPAAEARGIQVQTIVDPRAGPIAGDPDRLQQVFWNLMSNAVKFTPKHGHVQVRVERIDSSIEIVVSDNGIGIRPEFLPHLFERFRQGDAAGTHENSGLGLGLAIVRHLVELHGGSVTASSAGEGQGATFRVRLPIMSVQPADVHDQPRLRSRRLKSRPHTPAKLTGLHVLAVDDDWDALHLVREILESASAHVTTVESALKALEHVQTDPPDVILADIGMPMMDGFEFIERVRSLNDRRISSIPAAAVTAYARSEDRVRALESGFQMHLAKPVDPVELVAAIAALARQRDQIGSGLKA